MMQRMALVGIAAIAGMLVAACGPATSGTPRPPGTPRSPGTAAPPSTAAGPDEPKTGPPILLPGRFTGPAPAATPLQLRLIMKPGTSAASRGRLEQALAAAGMTVTATSPSIIGFGGTVAQVGAFFHVRLEGWRTPGGPLHVVATTQPHLPPSVAAAATDLQGFYLPGQRQAGGRRL